MNTPDAVPVALDTWPRREAYTFFSGLSDPFYSVTVTVDVTALHTYTKRRGLSFYYALVWLCTQSINHTTAFRYAIRNGQPVLLARREPSFTDLHPGAEQFHIVTMPAGDALEDFCRAARAKSRAQTEFLSAAAESDALIYFSCLPWVSLTALTNERDFDADDAIPRIVWGKYHREGGTSGCVETGAFGNEAYILQGYFNLPKILELTLYDGYDHVGGQEQPVSGLQPVPPDLRRCHPGGDHATDF